MKYVPLIILIASLIGCATGPVSPVAVQKVEIPVRVLCTTPTPNVPVWNIDSLKSSDTIFIKTRAALADIQLHIGYEVELLAALESCK